MKVLILSLINILLHFCYLSNTSVSAENSSSHQNYLLNWITVGDDFEIAELTYPHHTLIPAKIFLVRISLRKYSIKAMIAARFGEKRLDIKKLSEKSGALFGINANYFDPNYTPLGLIITEKEKIQNIHWGGGTLTSIAAYSKTFDTFTIKNRADFPKNFSGADIYEAIQAGPMLIVNSVPTKLKNSNIPSRRAGVCIDAQARLIFFCTSSGPFGLSFNELKSLLQFKDINCIDAMNFDGGGSAQMFLNYQERDTPLKNQKAAQIFIPGLDPVPVGLGIFKK
jgi:uncharacterized protein YigE (DUF2233 family)